MTRSILEFESCLFKALVFALRHAPEVWGIELDHQGWTDVRTLIETLGLADSRLAFVHERDLKRLVRRQSFRFEWQDDRIRALYGHSVPFDPGPNERPPEYLLHVTAMAAWADILREGLTSQGRPFVHLTTDRSYANLVGQKHGADSVLVVVSAGAAHSLGQRFWRANESIWLTETLSPAHLCLESESIANSKREYSQPSIAHQSSTKNE